VRRHRLTEARRPAPQEPQLYRAGRRRQRLTGSAIARQLGTPVSTIGKVLRRLMLGSLAVLEPKAPVVRYPRERPGELIHIDVKKLGRIKAPEARCRCEYVHVCIDDASLSL
jgi:hypothetical protein